MNNIKNTFSIKDLENLTGIKAHTIRIWEKRYNLLQPKRTETNIRNYTLENLQKLLNISYLNNNGFKISKIAKLDKKALNDFVKQMALQTGPKDFSKNAFKLSMLNFDEALFNKTYINLLKELSFKDIVYNYFFPLLSETGLLWQTNTITPAQEHFVFSIIRQKILVQTELIQSKNRTKKAKTFVLFLPDNEVHELGLMYINYEIISKGYHSIFLGQSVPINNLKDVQLHYNNITYISYFTIKPEKEKVNAYLNEFFKKIIAQSNSSLWVLGKILEHIALDKLPEQITSFKSIEALVKKL